MKTEITIEAVEEEDEGSCLGCVFFDVEEIMCYVDGKGLSFLGLKDCNGYIYKIKKE